MKNMQKIPIYNQKTFPSKANKKKHKIFVSAQSVELSLNSFDLMKISWFFLQSDSGYDFWVLFNLRYFLRCKSSILYFLLASNVYICFKSQFESKIPSVHRKKIMIFLNKAFLYIPFDIILHDLEHANEE